MVNGASLLLPFAVVVLLWFVGTGLVAMVNHRLRAGNLRPLLIGCACAFVGLASIVVSAHSVQPWAIYASFLGGLLIWSWHEIGFLTGAVTGSHREACPADAGGWQRFSMATLALIHHEVALAMTAALLLSLAAFTTNTTGAYVFALLLLFRLSSKLNIFWGVPHLSDELLPRHLDYLKSYFGPKRLRPVLPLSILLIVGCALWFAGEAWRAERPEAVVHGALLCGLSLLAALEHLFLALPIRDSALWSWAMAADGRRAINDIEGEGIQP